MRVLLLNQCFYPDVVSTAQHLSDLAIGLAESGHDVTVIASDRGYDDPANRFPRRERWKGINIVRIPSVTIGKESKWRRALNFSSFLFVCALRLFILGRFDVIVSMTSPPLISFLGSLFVKLRGGQMVFWVMDMNPDEAIAAGWLKPNSATARLLSSLLNYSLRHAEKIVALDRFMSARIQEKGISAEKIVTIAPWSHSDAVSYDESGRRAFRKLHGLSDKFVVMYSGNHSPCHPLDTLIQAASELATNREIAFAFVGGGSEQTKVRQFADKHGLNNVLCLPYQPLDKLSGSLSAADLHVVVMGDAFAGIVHPCKVYNVLEVGTPFLYIGPNDSHVTDLMIESRNSSDSRGVRHLDVAGAVAYIKELTQNGTSRRVESDLTEQFSKKKLLPHMQNVLEAAASKMIPSSATISDSSKQPLAQ